MDALYDAVTELYSSGFSMTKISKWFGISLCKTRKILITAELYENDTTARITELRDTGMLDKHIAIELGLSESAINSYSPYRKCMYNQLYPTKNALAIRRSRRNNKQVIANG